MDERDGDHGGCCVGCGAKGVAGEHAEATGGGGKSWRESNLHGEVSDGAGGEIGCRRRGESGGKSHALVDPFLIRFCISYVDGPSCDATTSIGGEMRCTRSADRSLELRI